MKISGKLSTPGKKKIGKTRTLTHSELNLKCQKHIYCVQRVRENELTQTEERIQEMSTEHNTIFYTH